MTPLPRELYTQLAAELAAQCAATLPVLARPPVVPAVCTVQPVYAPWWQRQGYPKRREDD